MRVYDNEYCILVFKCQVRCVAIGNVFSPKLPFFPFDDLSVNGSQSLNNSERLEFKLFYINLRLSSFS